MIAHSDNDAVETIVQYPRIDLLSYHKNERMSSGFLHAGSNIPPRYLLGTSLILKTAGVATKAWHMSYMLEVAVNAVSAR